MSDEQALQLMKQMQALEEYFAYLNQQEATMISVLREATSAIETLKTLKTKPESDTMMPIGMGAYVKSKILSDDKILLNIGAGIAVEKNVDSAMNYLEKRLKEIEIAVQDVHAKKQDVAKRLEQGKSYMNQLLHTSEQKSERGNV